ncbi:hypothetical protein V6N11_053751 [Hibiscus sabdariffa]|uniref:Uncharacterized protein n=1 Tax=Hibiscus sabdariffa TaxID=183260 RepID=A0ABR2S1W1_9ROSI
MGVAAKRRRLLPKTVGGRAGGGGGLPARLRVVTIVAERRARRGRWRAERGQRRKEAGGARTDGRKSAWVFEWRWR